MKKLTLILVCISFFLVSCGGEATQSTDTAVTTSEAATTATDEAKKMAKEVANEVELDTIKAKIEKTEAELKDLLNAIK